MRFPTNRESSPLLNGSEVVARFVIALVAAISAWFATSVTALETCEIYENKSLSRIVETGECPADSLEEPPRLTERFGDLRSLDLPP